MRSRVKIGTSTECVVADLGGTFLRCAVAARSGALEAIERIRLPGDARSRGGAVWRDVIEAIDAYVERHAARLSTAASIVFAVPGPVTGGRITAAPTVLGGDAALPDIAAELGARTARGVALINDVSAAAWYFSERVAARRFIVVTVSSGIGAKLFDREHPRGVLDDVPSAGEIGHLVVEEGPGAAECDCGGRGHLGAISSGRAFERRARRAAADDREGFAQSANVTRFGASAATLTNEDHLVPAILAGDRWSCALLAQTTGPLARILRSVCVASGLDGIVLMGGFAQTLGESYRAPVADAVGMLADHGPARAPLRASIVVAGPREEPSLAGAAVYARRRSHAG